MLSFNALTEKKTKVKLNPKMSDVMEGGFRATAESGMPITMHSYAKGGKVKKAKKVVSEKNHGEDCDCMKCEKKRRSEDLFLFFDESGKPQDVKAYHVNDYIQDISGEKFTAKDFRTWGGTKLAAKKITEFRKKDDKKQRKKNITKMVKDVAKILGNTPAVCRGSYIHPRFINDYLRGSFFRLWKETLGEQMYPLTENESHVIRYLENS